VQPGNGGADGVRGDHILICPPFTLSRAEADQIVEILRDVFKDVQKKCPEGLGDLAALSGRRGLLMDVF
jgi:hypothetical protein